MAELPTLDPYCWRIQLIPEKLAFRLNINGLFSKKGIPTSFNLNNKFRATDFVLIFFVIVPQ